MTGAKRTVPRQSARAILVNPDGRILLFKYHDPRQDVIDFWVTPGGGLEQGETFEDAVKRELWEEVGLKNAQLGQCVWHRFSTFRFDDHLIALEEKYFIVKTGRIAVNAAHPELEGVPLVGHKWWRRSEIMKATSEVFFPKGFGTLLSPVLSNTAENYPLTLGE